MVTFKTDALITLLLIANICCLVNTRKNNRFLKNFDRVEKEENFENAIDSHGQMRFFDELGLIPQTCKYKGTKFECGLSISCVLGGGRPVDLCSGGLIWSCCVDDDDIPEKIRPTVGLLQNATFSINLGHQQPYVDDDVHIYGNAIRPSRPSHSQMGPHRPPFGKPTTNPYDPSYAIWNHDRPTNDLAIGHDRPTYTTSRPPHHTIQDYSQDEYNGGYPSHASGIHVSTFEEASNAAVDYSRYRGNRTRMHTQTCCILHADMCRARCMSRFMKPINRRVQVFSMLLGVEFLLPTLRNMEN